MKADIIWLASTDSTNTEAKRRISDIDNLSVLSALSQTEGRGQRGNTWSSKPGENLTFSIVLKFQTDSSRPDGKYKLKACNQFVISQIASLSLSDFLSGHGIASKIKWPNDIYVGQRKIAGILIENSIQGEWLSSCIAGIGLNINQTVFGSGISNPTSMAICKSRSYDIRLCLEEFMEIFISYLERYLDTTAGYAELNRKYLTQLWRRDEISSFIDYRVLPAGHLKGPVNIIPDRSHKGLNEGFEFQGIIREVSDRGKLIVEIPDSGDLHEFDFKEIGFILSRN